MSSKTKNKHLLIIGPLPNPEANKVGGARVSFNYLIDYFKAHHLDHALINTKVYDTGWKQILNPFLILSKFIKNQFRTDIIFVNVSQGGTRFLVPLLYFFSKVLAKKFVFRPFGGSLKEEYKKYSKFQKWIFDHTALRSDIFYLQTQQLIGFFKAKGGNTKWLPTSRYQPEMDLPETKSFKKRFIYLGHVKTSKGIDLILEAVEKLGNSYTVHIYGPVKEQRYAALRQEKDSPYKGLVKSDKVLDVLQQYDVLLLPTHFYGEGYPGAIIEAYSMGLPVITTKWRAIPEIVEDGKTGLLIPPKSVGELLKAMRYFNEENYQAFSENARNKFLKEFDADLVHQKLYRELQSL